METVKAIPAPNVDAYLNEQPEKVRKALQKLRETILKAVPGAEEVISYRVPTIKYKGGLVAFAAFPKHCSLFIMSPGLMGFLKEDLRPYDVSGVTIHFTPEKQLPASLILKIAKARMRENEALSAAREQKAVSRKKFGAIPSSSANSAPKGGSRKKSVANADSPKNSGVKLIAPKKSADKAIAPKKSADNPIAPKKSAAKAVAPKKSAAKGVASKKSAADNSISTKRSVIKAVIPRAAVKATR